MTVTSEVAQLCPESDIDWLLPFVVGRWINVWCTVALGNVLYSRHLHNEDYLSLQTIVFHITFSWCLRWRCQGLSETFFTPMMSSTAKHLPFPNDCCTVLLHNPCNMPYLAVWSKQKGSYISSLGYLAPQSEKPTPKRYLYLVFLTWTQQWKLT